MSLSASTINLTGITLTSPHGGCYDTVQTYQCAPVGVTNVNSTTLLNNGNDSTINIAPGIYQLVLQPFWQIGQTINVSLSYSNNTTESASFLFGSLTTPTNFVRTGGSTNLSLASTGIQNVDLMNGYNEAPLGFGHDGAMDQVLILNTQAGSEVPEPASMALFGTGAVALAFFRRKRSNS